MEDKLRAKGRVPKQPPKQILVSRVSTHAEFPIINHSDCEGNAGAVWTITLAERADGRTEDTANEGNKFSTGLKITPPEGFCVEIIPDEALHDLGYMLMGPVVLTSADSGSVVTVTLFKFAELPDLDLPCRILRAVLKPLISAHVSIEGIEPQRRAEGAGKANKGAGHSLARKGKGKKKIFS